MTKKTIDVAAPVASHVFETRSSSVRIVTRLYGEITPERLTLERSIAQHRAEQLAPVIKRVQRPQMDDVWSHLYED